MKTATQQLVAYRVWDAPTRWFHWINALSILGLMLVGILILFAGTLGIPAAGRVTVKAIHVWLGYVMTLNLIWRLVWAFLGNRYANWRAVLPGGTGYLRALEAYVAAFVAGRPSGLRRRLRGLPPAHYRLWAALPRPSAPRHYSRPKAEFSLLLQPAPKPVGCRI